MVTSRPRIGVLRHPLRTEILTLVSEASETSPSWLAERLDISLGVCAYHVRCLQKAGLLRSTRTVPVRGTIEHYYRLKPKAVADLLEDLRAHEAVVERLLEKAA
jgi:DNA-binding Lrp family transcriptional regulator